MKQQIRNCDGAIRGRKSPWYRVIEGKSWDRCPWAELADDPLTSEWIGRWADTKRLQIRPASLDDLSSREVIAFRTIEIAIADVHQREADKAQRAREAADRKRKAGAGSKTPAMSAAQRKARASGKHVTKGRR